MSDNLQENQRIEALMAENAKLRAELDHALEHFYCPVCEVPSTCNVCDSKGFLDDKAVISLINDSAELRWLWGQLAEISPAKVGAGDDVDAEDAFAHFAGPIKAALAELDALKAALPKTADEKPETIFPGKILWFDEGDGYELWSVDGYGDYGNAIEVALSGITNPWADHNDARPSDLYARHPETGEPANLRRRLSRATKMKANKTGGTLDEG